MLYITKKYLVALAVTAMAVYAVGASAATQSVTANIAFDTALSITKNSDINFGVVKALTADTYTITTAGVVTAGGGAGNILSGTPTAGNLTIVGSATQLIDISVGSYTANNGVTPSAATCAYNGGGAGACPLTGVAAPGAGKTLLLGAQVAASGAQAAGTSAAPTFVVTVLYQ